MTTNDKNTERIEKQAYDWVSVMHSDCKTAEEVKQFQLWLEADIQHAVIYDEVYALWSELSNLQDVIEPGSYQALGEQSLWQRLNPFRLSNPAMAGFAGLTVLLCLSLAMFSFWSPAGLLEDDGYATQTAEIKEIKLPDTSRVTLGALSAIEVDYSQGERHVELIAGEAFFAVEHDAGRPFVVTVADTEIRVLGTKFDVRRSEEGVRVSVLEGKVEVIQSLEQEINGVITPLSTTRVLTAEERIRTQAQGELSEIETTNRARPGMWREGRLIYENATLAEVISDADRYYNGNIIIDTEDLKDLPVSAAFRTDQIQEMMDTLSVALPVSAKKLSNGDIIIQRRDKSRS